MFFVLSKVAGFFLMPSNLLLLVGVFGAVLLATRFARAGRRILVGAVIGIAVVGLSPLGNALILPLENRFPAWDPVRGAPHGIVVLGGALDGIVSSARGSLSFNEAGERLTETVALARRYPQARVLFTGGSGTLIVDAMPEAVMARQFFADMGLASERLLLEGDSRNTSENAIFSKRLANPQPGERWLLVTSAFHMPRSIGIFRREGFPVEAYPVDWRTRGNADLVGAFDRVSEGLRRTDIAVREWVGLLAYWLTGRSSALFPAP